MNVELRNVNVFADKNKQLLYDLNLNIESGQFLAILGENGAGKTSLLDMLMGFRKPTAGSVTIAGYNPWEDSYLQRQEISYLSEKIDLPGDWSVREFLDFNRYFYPNYDSSFESELLIDFKVNENSRLGGMSAGELRRAQIVAGLSSKPKLVIIDEITAVLDIVGRRLLMRQLSKMNKASGTTILLATNILEDLQNYISHVLIIRKGRAHGHVELQKVLDGRPAHEFSQVIADQLETV